MMRDSGAAMHCARRIVAVVPAKAGGGRVRGCADAHNTLSSVVPPSVSEAGTHTPQSIDILRRMGPRLRGDDGRMCVTASPFAAIMRVPSCAPDLAKRGSA